MSGTGDAAFVRKIIQNAREEYSESKKRHRTLFFKIVTAGTTDLISQVITTLKSGKKDDTTLLKWLLGNNRGNVEGNPKRSSCLVFLKCLFMIPLWIISTPFFYLMHGILNGLLNSEFIFSKTSISKFDHLDFPLAFAVLSTNQEMVKLFMRHGTEIDCKDRDRNNIFHYIADLSRKDLALAQACYLMLQKLIAREKLLELALHSRNKNHYTPIEYATHFGSIQFAVQMVEDTMQENVLAADRASATFSTDAQENNQSTFTFGNKQQKASTSGASSSSIQLDVPNRLLWTEDRMNISTYEKTSNNGQCSFFIHLLMSRLPINLSESEIKYVIDNVCVYRWMLQKFKQWFWVIVVVGFVELAFSVTISIGVVHFVQGDFNLSPNKDDFVNTHVQVFLNLWRNSNPTDTYYNMSQMFFEAYPDIETLLSNGEYQTDYIELKNLISRLPEYTNFDSSDMTSLYEAYCATGSVYFLVGDLVSIDNCTKLAAENFIASCKEVNAQYRPIFVFPHLNDQKYEYVIATSFLLQIHSQKRRVFTSIFRETVTMTEALLMLSYVFIYAFLYLGLDIVTRLICLIKQIQNNFSFYFLFATPVEGSYVKGQANCFSLFACMVLVLNYFSSLSSLYSMQITEVILRDEFLFYDRHTADYVSGNAVLGFFFVLLFSCRIIVHLNILKLVPWIGKFIITTFQLTVELFHFTVVYTVMIFLFGSLFYVLSRSDRCPDERDDNNFYFHQSLFSTFALAFGHIDFSFQNIAIKMAYILFVFMSVVLLLNLIIALMGASASLITKEPFLPFLIRQAHFQEAIGLESWASKICGFSKIKYHFLKYAGFIVENNHSANQDAQVYVRVFHLKRNIQEADIPE